MIIVLQAGFKLDQILLEKQRQISLAMLFLYLQMETALLLVQIEMIDLLDLEVVGSETMEAMLVFMNLAQVVGLN